MDDDTDYEDETEEEEGKSSPTTGDQEDEEERKEEEDPEKVLSECMELFKRGDFIMEPDIIVQLKRFFSAEGSPETVIDLLCSNYSAVAQTGNLLAEMLCTSGMQTTEVQSLIEDHLKEMVMKHFDPKMADGIFKDESGTPDWLTEMIDHPTWRSLVYKLAEDYPDCLMLSFAIKLISDAGHQGEITSISTASQQLEVFARIMKTFVFNFLSGGEEKIEKNLRDFTKMVCHSEHTLLYSSALLHILSQESKGGFNIKRLFQEITRSALQAGHDATPIIMALNGAWNHPRASQALSAMLAKNQLNPADITILHKIYSSNDPPPVDLLRIPQLLDLLLDALFKPGSRIHPEHKPKYIFLLAFASSVYETPLGRKGSASKKSNVIRDELKQTISAIERVSVICTEKKMGSNELLAELNTLYNCIKISPVVSLGIVQWVKYTVMEKNYFQLATEHTPLHLALLDEVSASHSTLHSKVLDLLIHLFESPAEDLDVLVYMEVKKMLIDRMVHLLSKGCVMPVISYIKTCFQKQDTDVSLIRYFVTEVLDVVSPPYTQEFVNLFLPLVENPEVTGKMSIESEAALVSQFVNHCKSMT